MNERQKRDIVSLSVYIACGEIEIFEGQKIGAGEINYLKEHVRNSSIMSGTKIHTVMHAISL